MKPSTTGANQDRFPESFILLVFYFSSIYRYPAPLPLAAFYVQPPRSGAIFFLFHHKIYALAHPTLPVSFPLSHTHTNPPSLLFPTPHGDHAPPRRDSSCPSHTQEHAASPCCTRHPTLDRKRERGRHYLM